MTAITLTLTLTPPAYGVRYIHDDSDEPGFARFISLVDAGYFLDKLREEEGNLFQIVRYSDGEVIA